MRQWAWAVLTALALGGCAAPPRAPEGGLAPDPAAWRQWGATGRLAVAAGNEGGSGAFEWSQDEATTHLDLRGPLGAGGVRLVVTPDSLSFSDAAGRVLDADAARAELQARLGAELPWNQLRYWLLGVAAPGEAAVVSDSGSGRVIEQSGWRLTYESFAQVHGLSLPKRFSVERGPVRVRVVVDRWSPQRSSGSAPEVPR